MLERWQRPPLKPGPTRRRLVGRRETRRSHRQPRGCSLIEDEPGIVDFVRRGLEAEGFAVEAALDGIEGERLALSDGFDAIVLDLMLPGRSGLEILAAVRRATPSVPVIVLTARGEIDDRVDGPRRRRRRLPGQAVLAGGARGSRPRPAARARAGLGEHAARPRTSRSTC